MRRKSLIITDSRAGKVYRRSGPAATADQRRRRLVMNSTAALLAAVIVILIVWGLVSVIADIMKPEPIESQVPIDEAAAQFSDIDSLCILVTKLSDDKTVPEQTMIARFEPSEARVYVNGLPRNLTIDGSSLAEHYARGGTAGLSSAVAKLIDVEQICPISFTYDDIKPIINVFDTVTVTVPYGINYTSPDGSRNIITAVGTREWTGGELARLLNYPNWEGGEREHLHMYTSVLVNLINENATWKSAERLKADFVGINAAANVEIPMGVYHMASDGLLYLAERNDGKIAVDMDIRPVDREDGTCVYSGDSLTQLRAVFGRRDLPEDSE
ncbi:MAG: hypothetical protein IJC18_03515 [Clostridia bacterium]|nr:hypothetical protein [Clostridia bacterium]